MKKILIAYLIIVSFACNTNRHLQGSQIGLVNLNHYYLKNSVSLDNDYTGIVISNQAIFADVFYADNTTDEKMIVPNFSGQMVIALVVNSIDQDRNITFTKAEINGKYLNVYGNLSDTKEDAETVPTAVATVPKSMDVKEVNFYIDGKLVKTSPVTSKNASNTLIDVTTQEQQQSITKNVRRRPVVI